MVSPKSPKKHITFYCTYGQTQLLITDYYGLTYILNSYLYKYNAITASKKSKSETTGMVFLLDVLIFIPEIYLIVFLVQK